MEFLRRLGHNQHRAARLSAGREPMGLAPGFRIHRVQLDHQIRRPRRQHLEEADGVGLSEFGARAKCAESKNRALMFFDGVTRVQQLRVFRRIWHDTSVHQHDAKWRAQKRLRRPTFLETIAESYSKSGVLYWTCGFDPHLGHHDKRHPADPSPSANPPVHPRLGGFVVTMFEGLGRAVAARL